MAAWTITVAGGGASAGPYPGNDLSVSGRPLDDPVPALQAFVNNLISRGHSVTTAQIVQVGGTTVIAPQRRGNK